MIAPSKKAGERFFAEQAATLLGKSWCLGPDRENPDFTVLEGQHQFGLEVCEIFSGTQSKEGSHRKRKESDTQKTLNTLRHKYESNCGPPIIARFLGEIGEYSMSEFLSKLEAMNLSIKPIGYHDVIEVDKGEAMLRVHVTRALRANWFSVNDRVGWVDRNPIDRINSAIKKKSTNLPRYRECVGLDDIRLLVVSNRIMNSGKVLFSESAAIDTCAFQIVYFLSYPESITTFNKDFR